MSSIYKLELCRAFKNKRFYFALCLGLLIVVLHLVLWLPNSIFANKNIINGFPTSTYFVWICGNTISWQGYLYFVMLPLLATIPYGYSMFEDRKSAFMKQIITRCGKKDYYKAKFIAVFLSGGTVVIIPLIMNLLITMMFLPSFCPDPSEGLYGIGNSTMLSGLFYSHPNIYIGIYIIIDFIYAGLFASISILVSELTEHKFVVEIAPLFIYMFIDSIFGLNEKDCFQPVYFLTGSFYAIKWYAVFGGMLILAIITIGYIFLKGYRDEVF